MAQLLICILNACPLINIGERNLLGEGGGGEGGGTTNGASEKWHT